MKPIHPALAIFPRKKYALECPKYALDNSDTRTVDGRVLRRLIAREDFADVRAGDRGGYVESASNLSPDGNCWVYDRACVWGLATVTESATVKQSARIRDEAVITGRAVVRGIANVKGRATISGDAVVRGYARIEDDVVVTDLADVSGHATLLGQVRLSGEAKALGTALLIGMEHISGQTVMDKAAGLDTPLDSEDDPLAHSQMGTTQELR